MQIISTMVLYNYKIPVVIKKKIKILSWSITGKPSKYFPVLSRTYETKFKDFQGLSITGKKSRTFPGCGNPEYNTTVILKFDRLK